MGLAGTIRKGVAIAHRVTKGVQETVQHVTWVGQDGMGAPLTTVVPRLAFVEQDVQLMRMDDGKMVQVRAVLTFLDPITANGAAGRIEPVDPKDKFILSDGSTGPILKVSGLRKDAPFVSTVVLGV